MKWLRQILDPAPMYDLDLTKLSLALNGPAVRHHWLKALLEQLRELNLEIDRMLERNDPQSRYIEISARRRQLVAILQQIETSKNSVELEVDHNQESLLDTLAVERAPGN